MIMITIRTSVASGTSPSSALGCARRRRIVVSNVGRFRDGVHDPCRGSVGVSKKERLSERAHDKTVAVRRRQSRTRTRTHTHTQARTCGCGLSVSRQIRPRSSMLGW